MVYYVTVQIVLKMTNARFETQRKMSCRTRFQTNRQRQMREATKCFGGKYVAPHSALAKVIFVLLCAEF